MPADATTVSLRTDTAEVPAARRDAPQQQPERIPREQPQRPIEMFPEPEKAPKSPRRPWRRRIGLGRGLHQSGSRVETGVAELNRHSDRGTSQSAVPSRLPGPMMQFAHRLAFKPFCARVEFPTRRG